MVVMSRTHDVVVVPICRIAVGIFYNQAEEAGSYLNFQIKRNIYISRFIKICFVFH